MNKLQAMSTALSKFAGRTGLQLRKHSPEILIGVGIIGVSASLIAMYKAVPKSLAVKEEYQDNMEILADSFEKGVTQDGQSYSSDNYQNDKTIVTLQTGVNFIKVFAPPVLIGSAAVACFLGAYGIVQKRNVALVAAYTAIEGAFGDYRRRVTEELGEEADMRFKTGIRKETVEIVGEDGKKHKEELMVLEKGWKPYSQYARVFDESCPQWERSSEYNMTYLIQSQCTMNNLLHARGHVFLNEVYDQLGFERTQAGALVGWLHDRHDTEHEGDGFIDFGIHEVSRPQARDFVNGYEYSIVLDFNVDGTIYDKI